MKFFLEIIGVIFIISLSLGILFLLSNLKSPITLNDSQLALWYLFTLFIVMNYVMVLEKLFTEKTYYNGKASSKSR